MQLIDCDLLNTQQAAEAGDPYATFELLRGCPDRVVLDDETAGRYVDQIVPILEDLSCETDYLMGYAWQVGSALYDGDIEKAKAWLIKMVTNGMARPIEEWNPHLFSTAETLRSDIDQAQAELDEQH
ncbi:MAG: hypothetical protein AAF632_28085 [Bacteroidota bacterium]